MKLLCFIPRAASIVAALASLCPSAVAQPFAYSGNDLLLGFRKTGAYQANYELVVNLGSATNYLDLAAGTTVPVPNFSPKQLSDSVGDFNRLHWSILGVSGMVGSPLPDYPEPTLWLTTPRTDLHTQSIVPKRQIPSGSLVTAVNIISILEGAVLLSQAAGTSNELNNAVLVREPVNDDSNLSAFVAGRFDPTASSLQDSWSPNVENVTPAEFSSPTRSDLYEARPETYLDPHTGLTSGNAYHVGHFQLNPDGTMVFTRASGSEPPPAPRISIGPSNESVIISFSTANGVLYRLYHAPLSGLLQPLSSWNQSATTVSGDGQMHSFTEALGASDRVYRVSAQ